MRKMPPRCRLACSMQLALAARTALVTLSHHARSLIPEAMCHEQLHCMRAPCTARPLSVSVAPCGRVSERAMRKSVAPAAHAAR